MVLPTPRKSNPYHQPWSWLFWQAHLIPDGSLPDKSLFHFVKLAKETGVDIFRVFDSLNNLENLKVGIDAVHAAGGLVEGAVMYTGDMLDPGCKYNLPYYMGVVDWLVENGAHVVAVKSMSGVMKPAAGRVLVRTIRNKYPDVPIHMHTHDTNGAGMATMVACVEAGADIVDTAVDSLSGSTSQPAASAMVASLQNSRHDSGLSLDQLGVIDSYWAQLRLMYVGFDADLRSPDPTIYRHEIPGGQYSNLMFQARQLGLGSQWAETLRAYEAANDLLGDIIKATPTSKAVGDLAQFMVDRHLSASDVRQQADTLDFPNSVVDYFAGRMGQPFDGFPEPLRTNVLRGRRADDHHNTTVTQRPGLVLPPIETEQVCQQIQARFPGTAVTEWDVASFVMFPEVYLDFRQARHDFGDLTGLRTPDFLVAPQVGHEICLPADSSGGRDVVVELVALRPADPKTGQREVLFRLHGELCAVTVQDDQGKCNFRCTVRHEDTERLIRGQPLPKTKCRRSTLTLRATLELPWPAASCGSTSSPEK